MSQNVGKLRCRIAQIPLYIAGNFQIYMHELQKLVEKRSIWHAFIASFAAYGNIFYYIAYNVFILQYHKCREQMQNA